MNLLTVNIHGIYSFLQEALFGVLLELACRRTQNFTKNDQAKPKIEQIYLHLEPHDYRINYVNIDLSHENEIAFTKAQVPLLAKQPSGEEQREMAIFVG